MSLCRLLHIDRELTGTGRLPCGGAAGGHIGKLKSFAGDPKFVIETSLDAIDKRGDTKDLKEIGHCLIIVESFTRWVLLHPRPHCTHQGIGNDFPISTLFGVGEATGEGFV